MGHKTKTLWMTAILTFSMIVSGFAKDSVELNKSKQIAGNLPYEQLLDVDLVTEHMTRLQIIVKNKDEISQNHRLTIGPKGVVDGKYRGAIQWGFELPPKSENAHFEVMILVEDFAGTGSPVSYQLKSKQPEADSGFCYQGS